MAGHDDALVCSTPFDRVREGQHTPDALPPEQVEAVGDEVAFPIARDFIEQDQPAQFDTLQGRAAEDVGQHSIIGRVRENGHADQDRTAE